MSYGGGGTGNAAVWIRRLGYVALGGASIGLVYGAWTETFSIEFVTAVATVILVLVTATYAHLTWGHLDAARRQAAATEATFAPDLNTDYYLLHDGIRFIIVNRGEGVARNLEFRVAIDTADTVYVYLAPIETSLQTSTYIDLELEPTFYIESRDISGESVEELMEDGETEVWDIDRESETMFRRGLLVDLLSKLAEGDRENPDIHVAVSCTNINGSDRRLTTIIENSYLDLSESNLTDAVLNYSGSSAPGDEYWSNLEIADGVVYEDDLEAPKPQDVADL
jgi:hypothetical protein